MCIRDKIELVINLKHALAMIERLPSQSRKAFNYEAQIAKIEEEIERYQKPVSYTHLTPQMLPSGERRANDTRRPR